MGKIKMDEGFITIAEETDEESALDWLKGIGTGMATGAATGATVGGPWGALIGAIGGGVIGAAQTAQQEKSKPSPPRPPVKPVPHKPPAAKAAPAKGAPQATQKSPDSSAQVLQQMTKVLALMSHVISQMQSTRPQASTGGTTVAATGPSITNHSPASIAAPESNYDFATEVAFEWEPQNGYATVEDFQWLSQDESETPELELFIDGPSFTWEL